MKNIQKANIQKAMKWLTTHDWSNRESLCECIDTKYNGDIDLFLDSEFNVVKDGVLHIKWGEGKGEKVSYDL